MVHPTAVVDYVGRPYQGRGRLPALKQASVISPNAHVGPFCIVEQGCKLEDGVIVDCYSRIGKYTHLLQNVLIIYGATIGPHSVISRDAVVGGQVPEYGVVGERSRIFGRIVHSQYDTVTPWDELPEPEPTPQVLDDCFVAFGAVLTGKISVGPNAYVCANASISIDVPPMHIAYGINKLCHYSEWKGRLSEASMFLEK